MLQGSGHCGQCQSVCLIKRSSGPPSLSLAILATGDETVCDKVISHHLFALLPPLCNVLRKQNYVSPAGIISLHRFWWGFIRNSSHLLTSDGDQAELQQRRPIAYSHTHTLSLSLFLNNINNNDYIDYIEVVVNVLMKCPDPNITDKVSLISKNICSSCPMVGCLKGVFFTFICWKLDISLYSFNSLAYKHNLWQYE